MKKVALISGITGQDGSFLAEFLIEKGYEVHGILRRSSSFNTGRIEHLYLDEWVRDMQKTRLVNLHWGDMTDSSSLIRIIQAVQPDEIYNLAAQSHVKVSFDVPEYTAEADAVGTLRMLEAVRILGLEKKTKIYQASTSELFGLVQEVPQKETTPFYPRSPYGVAKQYGFWITKNYRESYGMFAVWNDHCGNGVSQQDVHFRTFPATQVLAEKMWRGKNEMVSYEEFEKLCKQMPEAPGINLLGRVQGEVVFPGQNEELSLNGTDSIATMLPEIGYPYAVEFEINPDKEQNINGILFKGPHSTVYANWENKGKLAFSRDGYTFVFHAATLPAGAWTKVRIEGDHKGTTLYINGEKAERLEGRVKQFYNYIHKRKDKMYMQETLVFPMRQIGDVQNGFRGKLRNINCMQ